MAKIADEYLKIDPWKIIEDDWNYKRNMVSESLFSLGNEYMGVRGYFEEGTEAPSLKGSYFNGVYEVEKTEGTSYKGIVQKTHFMVNAVDYLFTRITIDDETLMLGSNDLSSKVSNYYRELNMQCGTVVRRFVWHTKSGKDLEMEFTRFLDMENPENAFQKISITPLNCSGQMLIRLGSDFSILHEGRKKCYWKEITKTSIPNGEAILSETLTTAQKIFSGFTWKSNSCVSYTKAESELFAGVDCAIKLEKGKTSFIEKHIINIVDKKNTYTANELWKLGLEKLGCKDSLSFSSAQENQKKYWSNVWNTGDILIEGDEKNQQGIRFCIFQMHQTYHGLDESNNIGAKGLTGEAYNGHAFWDTETYCLPFYLYTNLKAAKNLLEFRYETLTQAKERAKMLDCKGACYPVATLNGEEACNLWQHASLQFQPSTGVAYGIAHYVAVSGDKQFLYSHGLEMLLEISRFLISRGAWNQDRTGFGFYAVMGPDEFHMMVNNNVYTNFMAKKTFEYTLEVLKDAKYESPNDYKEITKKLNFSKEEEKEILLCAKKMIILQKKDSGLYEQHEGFFGLPHIDVNSIPISDFPLYGHWSYDRIYRTDMIKQPDVLMFLFLYRTEFAEDVLEKNYDFYEPKTIHESSLSPSVHSVLATELGKNDEAFRFFRFATRLDLDNYNRNTAEGLHTTSIAAAWVNIVFGFGGMVSSPSTNGTLSFAPVLPTAWKGYEFRVVYKNTPIRLCVKQDGIRISKITKTDTAIKVSVYGKVHELLNDEILIPLKQSQNLGEENGK